VPIIVFLGASAAVFLGLNPTALLPLFHGAAFDPKEFIRTPQIGLSFAGTVAFIAEISCAFLFFSRLDEPGRRICCLMVSPVTQLGLLVV
jgi:hypothetical protein